MAAVSPFAAQRWPSGSFESPLAASTGAGMLLRKAASACIGSKSSSTSLQAFPSGTVAHTAASISAHQDTITFLALLRDHSEARLRAARPNLPGAARLARRLGAGAVLSAIQDHLCTMLRQPDASEPQLMRWLQLAEELRLVEVQVACLAGLARHVSSAPSPVAALLRIVRLTRCGEDSKRLLLRATRLSARDILAYMQEMKAALHSSKSPGSRPARAMSAPAPHLPADGGATPDFASVNSLDCPPEPRRRPTLEAQPRPQWSIARQGPQAAEISWSLPGFAGLPEAVDSPVFELGTQQWRLLAYPRGRDGRARHFSLYLAAVGGTAYTPFACWQQGVRFTLEVVNCKDGQLSRARSESHTFCPAQAEYGFTTFMSLSTLLETPGFLGQDGSITIRACLRLADDL